MKDKPNVENDKCLSKTQEVLYQKEFRRADRTYNQLTQKGNRNLHFGFLFNYPQCLHTLWITVEGLSNPQPLMHSLIVYKNISTCGLCGYYS